MSAAACPRLALLSRVDSSPTAPVCGSTASRPCSSGAAASAVGGPACRLRVCPAVCRCCSHAWRIAPVPCLCHVTHHQLAIWVQHHASWHAQPGHVLPPAGQAGRPAGRRHQAEPAQHRLGCCCRACCLAPVRLLDGRPHQLPSCSRGHISGPILEDQRRLCSRRTGGRQRSWAQPRQGRSAGAQQRRPGWRGGAHGPLSSAALSPGHLMPWNSCCAWDRAALAASAGSSLNGAGRLAGGTGTTGGAGNGILQSSWGAIRPAARATTAATTRVIAGEGAPDKSEAGPGACEGLCNS